MREAPSEISDTLMSRMVAKIRAAIPGVPRIPSPTIQMMARPVSTAGSPSAARSRRMAGRVLVSSTESDTLTSEVATRSTTVRCRSNTSNSARKNPYAPSIRVEVTLTIETPVLCAIAFTVWGTTSDSAATRVPSFSGARELRMRTGMPWRMAGRMVLGCSTRAPK